MANLLLPHHESDDEDHVNLGDASVQSDTNIAASQPSRPPTPSESQGNITMGMKRYRTRHNTLALLPKVFVLPQQKTCETSSAGQTPHRRKDRVNPETDRVPGSVFAWPHPQRLLLGSCVATA